MVSVTFQSRDSGIKTKARQILLHLRLLRQAWFLCGGFEYFLNCAVARIHFWLYLDYTVCSCCILLVKIMNIQVITLPHAAAPSDLLQRETFRLSPNHMQSLLHSASQNQTHLGHHFTTFSSCYRKNEEYSTHHTMQSTVASQVRSSLYPIQLIEIKNNLIINFSHNEATVACIEVR